MRRHRARKPSRGALGLVALLTIGACSASSSGSPSSQSSSSVPVATTPRTTSSRSTSSSTSGPASTPPPTATTVATSTSIALRANAFAATVTNVTASQLPFTYRAGCPVSPAQLRLVRLSYWGFDDRPHTGEIVVAATVAIAVEGAFRSLYEQRFPIRSMRPVDAFAGSDPQSMAADNTSGFNCRNAVASGPPRWSAHAYGTAIDVNPVENPYVEGGTVQPAEGEPFADRSRARPGMAEPDGVLNRAFAAVGWQWGGRWTATPDYQHFSATGG